MRDVNLSVTPRGQILVPAGTILGRAGEVGATRLYIDVSAWADAAIGVYSVVGKRSGRAVYALGAALTSTDGIVTVDVPAALLGLPGYAQIEVRGEATGVIVKSASVLLNVLPSVTSGDPDACYDYPWIDEMTQAATHLDQTMIEAGERLQSLKDVSFTVDENGHLILDTPTERVTASINADGHLILEVE